MILTLHSLIQSQTRFSNKIKQENELTSQAVFFIFSTHVIQKSVGNFIPDKDKAEE